MTKQNRKNEVRTTFHGYYVIIGAILPILLAGGAIINSFGVLLPSVCDLQNWSRATTAGALSFNMIAFGLPSPIFGIAVSRFGPKRCIILGNAIAAAALASVYFITEIWQFYAAYTLTGLGSGLGGYIASTSLANNWFVKRRSIAMGFLISSAGLGGFIFPPIVTLLINQVGLRNTYLFLAGLIIIGAVFIGGIILIKDNPADLGEYPDGMKPDPKTPDGGERSQDSRPVQAFRMIDQFKRPLIWLIILFLSTSSFAMGTMVTHQVAYFTDIGFNAMIAASAMSVLALSQLVGSLLYGALAMRINLRFLTAAHFVIQFFAILILLSTRNLALLYVYAALMGFSIGAITTSMPTIVGSYFPQQVFARVSGLILPFFLSAQAISAIVGGAIFDKTGSYTIAFVVLLALSGVGMVSSILAKKPTTEPEKQPTLI